MLAWAAPSAGCAFSTARNSLPPPCCSQIAWLETLLSLLVVCAEQTCSSLLLFGCPLYTSPLTRRRMGAELTCKGSRKMIKIMLFKGSRRSTDGEDFLLLYVFTAPLASGGQWHQSGCWHEPSRHHSTRPGPHLTDPPLPTCDLACSTVLIFGVKRWKFQKLKASTSDFFSSRMLKN